MDEVVTAAAGIADREQLAVCLCAEWCDTCEAYRVVFAAAARQFPDAHFVWLDIEDQEDLLGPIDVEDFPTVLIAVGADVRFFGTLTPQPETLTRMLRASFAADAAVAPAGEPVHTLLGRLRGA
jgi:thiol-disulfide isomerase/thioredoxin